VFSKGQLPGRDNGGESDECLISIKNLNIKRVII